MDIKRVVFDPSIVSKSVEQPADPAEMPKVSEPSGIAKIPDSIEKPLNEDRNQIFNPAERYSRVVLQEGRVQTDSDSSEDSVVVDFKAGQLRDPFVIGNLWDSDTDPDDSD